MDYEIPFTPYVKAAMYNLRCNQIQNAYYRNIYIHVIIMSTSKFLMTTLNNTGFFIRNFKSGFWPWIMNIKLR